MVLPLGSRLSLAHICGGSGRSLADSLLCPLGLTAIHVQLNGQKSQAAGQKQNRNELGGSQKIHDGRPAVVVPQNLGDKAPDGVGHHVGGHEVLLTPLEGADNTESEEEELEAADDPEADQYTYSIEFATVAAPSLDGTYVLGDSVSSFPEPTTT